MNLNHQSVGSRILNLRHVVVGYEFIDIGIRTLNYQNSLGIVATCSTHCLNESLLILCNTATHFSHTNDITFTCSYTWLIHAGKEKMLIICFEIIGNLSPYFSELSLGSLDVCIGCQTIVLNPTTIPVLVDDDIESILDAIIYHLFYSFHPSRVDGAFVSICDMSHYPRARNTDTLETGSLHSINQSLSGLGILPGSLCFNTNILPEILAVTTFKSVTEVPTWIHQLSHLHSGLVHISSWCIRNDNGTLLGTGNRNILTAIALDNANGSSSYLIFLRSGYGYIEIISTGSLILISNRTPVGTFYYGSCRLGICLYIDGLHTTCSVK